MLDHVLAGIGFERGLEVSGLLVLTDVESAAARNACDLVEDAVDTRQVTGTDGMDD